MPGFRPRDNVGFQGGPFFYFSLAHYMPLNFYIRLRAKCAWEALSDIITSRDVVENILHAKKCKVKEWLQDSYYELIEQAEPVNIDELRSSDINWETITRLCSAREAVHSSPLPVDINPLIASVFGDEMKETGVFE